VKSAAWSIAYAEAACASIGPAHCALDADLLGYQVFVAILPDRIRAHENPDCSIKRSILGVKRGDRVVLLVEVGAHGRGGEVDGCGACVRLSASRNAGAASAVE